MRITTKLYKNYKNTLLSRLDFFGVKGLYRNFAVLKIEKTEKPRAQAIFFSAPGYECKHIVFIFVFTKDKKNPLPNCSCFQRQISYYAIAK